ncbi:MAG: hypothetical protein RIC87_15510 [Kiloniellales bacterium]
MPDYYVCLLNSGLVGEVEAKNHREAARIAAGEDGWFSEGDEFLINSAARDAGWVYEVTERGPREWQRDF